MTFQVRLNNTEELEARVTVLEESVADLEVDMVEVKDNVEDAETLNLLQEQRLNTIEVDLLDNDEDIEGLYKIFQLFGSKGNSSFYVFTELKWI